MYCLCSANGAAILLLGSGGLVVVEIAIFSPLEGLKTESSIQSISSW